MIGTLTFETAKDTFTRMAHTTLDQADVELMIRFEMNGPNGVDYNAFSVLLDKMNLLNEKRISGYQTSLNLQSATPEQKAEEFQKLKHATFRALGSCADMENIKKRKFWSVVWLQARSNYLFDTLLYVKHKEVLGWINGMSSTSQEQKDALIRTFQKIK